VRLRYRDEVTLGEKPAGSEGSGARPALLLLHGWALELTMWTPQVPRLLALGYRVIRLDRRGFGESTGVPDVEQDASDAHRLLKQLGIERAGVLGMSQGARVALVLARSFPGLVTALVLDGPPELDAARVDDDDEKIPIERYSRILHAAGIKALRQELAQHPLMRLRTTNRTTRDLLAGMLGRYAAHDLRQHPSASSRVIPTDELHMPVLVVNGAHDNAPRLAAGERLAHLLRAERALVPASGHLPNLDNPVAYQAIIERFLARHGPPAPRRENRGEVS
jgi:pimeloyl-ACP methyl ester carboxylesterase